MPSSPEKVVTVVELFIGWTSPLVNNWVTKLSSLLLSDFLAFISKRHTSNHKQTRYLTVIVRYKDAEQLIKFQIAARSSL